MGSKLGGEHLRVLEPLGRVSQWTGGRCVWERGIGGGGILVGRVMGWRLEDVLWEEGYRRRMDDFGPCGKLRRALEGIVEDAHPGNLARAC